MSYCIALAVVAGSLVGAWLMGLGIALAAGLVSALRMASEYGADKIFMCIVWWCTRKLAIHSTRGLGRPSTWRAQSFTKLIWQLVGAWVLGMGSLCSSGMLTLRNGSRLLMSSASLRASNWRATVTGRCGLEAVKSR